MKLQEVNGITLKEMREDKKMSQKDLGTKIGVSQETISQYESGNRRPTITTSKKIADIFGITLDDFFMLLPFQNEIRKE